MAKSTIGFKKEDVKSCWSKISVTFKRHRVSAIHYSPKGKMLTEFPSILAAARKTNIPYHQIRAAIANKDLLTGYRWEKSGRS